MPGAWCQGASARDAIGFDVSPTDPTACQWCALGALWAEPAADWEEPRALLRQAARQLHGGASGVARLNDDARTTHCDVMAIYDRAIVLAGAT